MSGNAPVPPPPPHSEPAQQPPVFQPRSQQPVTPSASPLPLVPTAPDQQATAYQPVQPAYQPPAYQQPPAQPAYQAPPPAYQPPPAFAPGGGQQGAYQAQPPQQAYQPAYAEQPSAPAPGGGSGGRPGSGRRRLSPGWIAFIAVDVILVGIVVAFAINLAGGASGQDAADAPGTSAEAPAQAPDAPVENPGPVAVTGESVTSPSRNITCTIGEQGVSCGIAELATQPAPVDGCTGTTGYLVTLTSGGVEIPCVPTADQPKKAGDDVAVLDYDQSKTVGSFTCTSSKTGMRCSDSETGKGFNVAKAGLSSF
ncbi:hypothetical protein [Oerskovia paurometabola]|uniref:hypothetical protein n=1 Tax=Oerskovia paurometabola TaxID=162170 RepID=UPI00381A3A52